MTARRKVVVAIGLPGAGKSTYFARRGILPLSSDLIRELLYDNAADQRHPEWVFAALHDLLRRRLAAGAQTTYIDATNLTRYFRRPFLQIAQEFGCAAEALYFDVPWMFAWSGIASARIYLPAHRGTRESCRMKRSAAWRGGSSLRREKRASRGSLWFD